MLCCARKAHHPSDQGVVAAVDPQLGVGEQLVQALGRMVARADGHLQAERPQAGRSHRHEHRLRTFTACGQIGEARAHELPPQAARQADPSWGDGRDSAAAGVAAARSAPRDAPGRPRSPGRRSWPPPCPGPRPPRARPARRSPPSSRGDGRRGRRAPRRAVSPAPATRKPSSLASMSAPSPRRPSTTVAIRSDSLTRSSWAPRTTVSPSAKQPSRATSGSSSIANGTSSGSTDRALEGARSNLQLAHGLRRGELPRLLLEVAHARRPMRLTIRRKPVLVQLTPTPSTSSREPGTSTAGGRPRRPPSSGPRARPPSPARARLVRRPYVAAVAVDRDSRPQQHPLGVVTAARRLADRESPHRRSGRQQHAGLDLGARHGELVGDR